MERLQKILARAGIASRRAAEELITSGRVRVNGKVVRELGTKADPRRDKIEVDGKRIGSEDLVYLVLHKPRGCVSTLDDPEGRPTVRDLVKPVAARVFPVGRLDYATSGVLLMTNDGDFAHGLLHPRQKVPKIYVLKLDGEISDEALERWRAGIELDEGRTLPAEVQRIRNEQGKSWLRVTLFEGRNQQIRRMAEATGFAVMRLARVSFAGIDHEGLRPGDWRPLTVDELRKLKKAYGVPKRVRPAPPALLRSAKSRAERRPTPAKPAPAKTRGAEGGARRVRAERSDRSETTPRGADRRASRGRGRGRR